MYSVLANAVAVLHGILILALATGGAWILAGRGSATLRRAYIVLLGSLALSQVLLGECFLTGLEKTCATLIGPALRTPVRSLPTTCHSCQQA